MERLAGRPTHSRAGGLAGRPAHRPQIAVGCHHRGHLIIHLGQTRWALVVRPGHGSWSAPPSVTVQPAEHGRTVYSSTSCSLRWRRCLSAIRGRRGWSGTGCSRGGRVGGPSWWRCAGWATWCCFGTRCRPAAVSRPRRGRRQVPGSPVPGGRKPRLRDGCPGTLVHSLVTALRASMVLFTLRVGTS